MMEEGLEEILSGRASLEEFLARYPGKEALLRPELESAAWIAAQQKSFATRPGFVAQSRRRVLAQIVEETQAQPRQLRGSAWPSRLAFRWGLALLALVLLVGSASGVVSAAQASLPGQALYAIKRASEQVAYALVVSDVQRVEVSAVYVDRRMDEVTRLVQAGDEGAAPIAIAALEAQVDETLTRLEAVQSAPEEEKRALAAAISQGFSQNAQALEKLSIAAPPPVRIALEQAETHASMSASRAAEEAQSLPPLASETATATTTASPTGSPTPTATTIPSSTQTPAASKTPEPVLPTPDPTEEKDKDKKPTITPRPTNVHRPEKTDASNPGGKPDEKPPKPDKPDKPDKPVKPDKPEKPEKPEKPDKPDKDKDK
jgi:hypothetical protein